MLDKARGLPADEIVIDLEDGVAVSEKNDETRRLTGSAAAAIARVGRIVAVRVNGIHTRWFERDVAVVVEAARGAIDAVVVPKVESPQTVRFVERLLAETEARLGLPAIEIEAQIETARGLVEVERIAASSPRLATLIFGAGDFAASLGIASTTIGASAADYPGDQWHYVRARIATAAAAFGRAAIDTPYAAYSDEAGLEETARHARALGFAGKWAIHPSQIEPCNRIFAATEQEVAEAQRVLETLERAAREGVGAVGVDGAMLDEASRRIAEAVVARRGRDTS
jgi:citrate lyase subunit beta/citryl-CoA lyase